MNQHSMPFCESAEEATSDAIKASGLSPKEIACKVFPDKKPDTAYSALRDALNPNRPEKLTFDQHLLIARLTGNASVLYYAAHELSHSRPDPVTPEDRRAQLQRDFIDSVQRMERIKAELLGDAPSLRRVA